jgi:hypothetical protein
MCGPDERDRAVAALETHAEGLAALVVPVSYLTQIGLAATHGSRRSRRAALPGGGLGPAMCRTIATSGGRLSITMLILGATSQPAGGAGHAFDSHQPHTPDPRPHATLHPPLVDKGEPGQARVRGRGRVQEAYAGVGLAVGRYAAHPKGPTSRMRTPPQPTPLRVARCGPVRRGRAPASGSAIWQQKWGCGQHKGRLRGAAPSGHNINFKVCSWRRSRPRQQAFKAHRGRLQCW